MKVHVTVFQRNKADADFLHYKSDVSFSVKKFDGFEILHELYLMQKKKDILNLGCTDFDTFGIRSLSENKGMFASYDIKKAADLPFGGDITCPPMTEKERKYHEPIMINGKEVYIEIKISRSGYVLNSGQKCNSIFGLMTVRSAYFKSIGSRNFRCSQITECRSFDTLKSLNTFLEKNMETFKYMVSEYGYYWTVEDIENQLNIQYAAYEIKDREKTENLLKEANSSAKSFYPEPEKGEATIEEMKEEAIRRMNFLKISSQIKEKFLNSEIFCSDSGLIRCVLSETDERNIQNIRYDYGALIYHVIKTSARMSDDSILNFTDYLSVSKNKEYWDEERPNREHSHVWSYSCSEATYGDLECGVINVKPYCGGLIREAM